MKNDTKGLNRFEPDVLYRPVILVEAAGPQTMGATFFFGHEIFHGAEIDESNTAWAVRDDGSMRNPAVDLSPRIQNHVVHAVCDDLAEMLDLLRLDAINDEDASGNDVRGPIRQQTIGVDRSSGQLAQLHPSAAIADPADEDSGPRTGAFLLPIETSVSDA